MELVLKTIYYIIFIPVFLYSAYFVVTGLFLFKKNKHKIKRYKEKYKFGIIIASRNEENVIGNLIESIKNQDYSKELYEIFVFPNNCTDDTDKKAKELGATVIKCKEHVSSKGEVLKYAFKKLEQRKDIDSYIIFDADNVVHPNFLKRMNDTLCEGYEVAQGFRDSKNAHDNWLCGGYSLFYWGQNMFFSKARMSIGGSASINGTGFMIKKSVIDEIGFNTITVTEDIEFTAICALNNKRIAFVDDAITYDEQPRGFITSWKQRTRWSMGTFQCLTKYSKKLLKYAFKNNSLAGFDMSLFFFAPLIQIIGAILFVMLAIFSIIGIELSDFMAFCYANRILFLILTIIFGLAVEIFVVKYNKKKVFKITSGIICFPLFLLTWIPINIACLFKKKIDWEPVLHNRNIKIDNIIN